MEGNKYNVLNPFQGFKEEIPFVVTLDFGASTG